MLACEWTYHWVIEARIEESFVYRVSRAVWEEWIAYERRRRRE